MTVLNDSQNKAISKLQQIKVGALFMEPGTGKTLTAIKLIESTQCDYVLFLVPFQTKINLQKEFNKWKFEMNYEIQGIESLSSSDRLYMNLTNKIQKHKSVFLIVDESLKIKNSSAIRTKRILNLSRDCEFKLILNGTPLSKNMVDLWPQMEFLSPKILNMSEVQFKNTFCHYIKYRETNQYGKKGKWQEFIKGYDNVDYLYSLIDPYVFDADLKINKTKQYSTIFYDINANIDRYNELKQSFINSFSDDPDSFLKYTTLMQQAYCDEPSKLEAIKSLVDDKTLIFVKFLRSKDAIYSVYHNAKVFTYGKGSLGLNLQQYNKIIFFDKTFDYAQRDQAEHRIFRIGQDDNVNYYSLTGNVNLESTIDRNIKKKTNLLTHFKELTKTGVDIDWENII